MSDIQKGNKITSAFLYVQQVFKECQRLIFKIDNQLAPEWGTVYGNRMTKDVTTSLQEPDRWIVEAIFRVYENSKDKLVNKAITISFWGMKLTSRLFQQGRLNTRILAKGIIGIFGIYGSSGQSLMRTTDIN